MTDLPLSFAIAGVSKEARLAAVTEWNKGSADTTQMLLAVAAAVEVTEAQVRECIAADIEAQLAAYPTAVFRPITNDESYRAFVALEAIRLSLDRFSAEAMRSRIAEDARIARGGAS